MSLVKRRLCRSCSCAGRSASWRRGLWMDMFKNASAPGVFFFTAWNIAFIFVPKSLVLRCQTFPLTTVIWSPTRISLSGLSLFHSDTRPSLISRTERGWNSLLTSTLTPRGTPACAFATSSSTLNSFSKASSCMAAASSGERDTAEPASEPASVDSDEPSMTRPSAVSACDLVDSSLRPSAVSPPASAAAPVSTLSEASLPAREECPACFTLTCVRAAQRVSASCTSSAPAARGERTIAPGPSNVWIIWVRNQMECR
mmetsp:Transcript_47612/g.136165  ORF Transcript_47612/g.136165 Transcript_47612/m.136165 type:complete len:257 (+) Transcript_47612:1206-1976(+)